MVRRGLTPAFVSGSSGAVQGPGAPKAGRTRPALGVCGLRVGAQQMVSSPEPHAPPVRGGRRGRCFFGRSCALRGRLAKIKQWIDDREVYEGAVPLIPFSCDLESKVSTMTSQEREDYLKQLATTSVLPKIVVTGYKALQLVYFFTAGEDEVRAWTIRVRGQANPTRVRVLCDAR